MLEIKGGIGHFNTISPNKMDATYILNSLKWTLAELIRLTGVENSDKAQALINQIMERQVDIIWDDDETFMFLDKNLKTEEKILIALYKKDRLEIEELRILIDYKNKTRFQKIIMKLQSEKLLALTKEKICKLSPLGLTRVEYLLI